MPDDVPVVVVETPPSQPAIAATADAAVEIAQIEADRDVQLAETHGETATTVAEIQADTDEDLVWLRGELAGLRASCEMNAAALSESEIRRVEMTTALDSLRADLTALALIVQPIQSPPSEPAQETTETAEQPSEATESAGDQGAAETEQTAAERRRRRYL